MAPSMDAAHRGLTALAESGPGTAAGPTQRKSSGDPVDQAAVILSGGASDPGQSRGASSLDTLPRGGGGPLDASIAARVERATGTTLGDVRVHTGAATVQAAADLGARAFTTGTDIHVGRGEALNLLAGLDQTALEDAMARLGDDYKSRLLDNLPASARQTSAYTRVLVAMGPAAVQPYVQSLLSYGVFDWAITDADAQSVFRIVMALQGPQRARQNVLRDDGTRQDDPLYGVNRFDKVVRHEVGHAVDEENGHSDAYCVGNEGGGDWASLDRSGVAEALVNASGGDISAWPDAAQKTAIIACLQGVVDQRKPGELDARIDALAGLSAEDKTNVKVNKAVRALKGCFAMSGHNPWYKYPDTGGIALGERIFQEAYPGDWWSYKQSTRSRKVSTYQYRAPGEWFAEAYAAYYTPSANKGDLLARVDAATKAWFDTNVDPDGGRPNGSGPPPSAGDFPATTGGDGTVLA